MEGTQFLASVNNVQRLSNLAFEEGYQIEINLVDYCNLNCAGCNHFSPLAKKATI